MTEPKLSEVVASNLRALKAVRRLTDAQIADLVGMSRETVRNRMTGATPCSLEDVEHFATAFGIDVADLFEASHVRLFIDTSAVGVLVSAYNRATELGGSLMVLGVQPPQLALLPLTGVDNYLGLD